MHGALRYTSWISHFWSSLPRATADYTINLPNAINLIWINMDYLEYTRMRMLPMPPLTPSTDVTRSNIIPIGMGCHFGTQIACGVCLSIRWPIEPKFYLLFCAYVGIHQVRLVVFDNKTNYETCPVPSKDAMPEAKPFKHRIHTKTHFAFDNYQRCPVPFDAFWIS